MKDEKREESFSCAVCGKIVRVTLKPGDHIKKESFEDGGFACTTCVGENRGMYFDVGYNTWRWNKNKNQQLMELNSNKGIAGEMLFTGMDEVLRFVPKRDEYHYCDGDHHNDCLVTAVLSDGSQKELDTALHIGDGSNYVKDTVKDAPCIGEQIANLDVNALIFHRIVDNQNFDEDYEEYLPVENPDWKKVRRRVEDALRKTSNKEVLFSFAQKLNVKIF